jgi:hypothetical protein
MLLEELCLGTWRDIPSSDEALKTSVQNIEEVRLSWDKCVVLPGRN